jgi:hypothetical protein
MIKFGTCGYLAPLVLLSLVAAMWPIGGWAQEHSIQMPPFRAEPITPSKVPVTDPSTALGSVLAACDKAAEGYEGPSLPGAKAEIKIDQCYRGRDHLLCSFNAILAEADNLVQNYHEVSSANYPETANIQEACMKAPDRLASDLQSATDFAVRYKALKTAYEARANCAARVQKAVSEVVLTDVMTQAPSIVSSMVDTIRADLQPVSTAAATAAEVSQRIEASYKAILTLQKIHRAMCLRPEGGMRAIGAPDNRDKL